MTRRLPFITPPTRLQRAGRYLLATVPAPAWDGTQACLDNDDFTQPVKNPLAAARLKQICTHCRFFTACRDYSVAHETANYWAGLTESARHQLRQQYGLRVNDPYLVSDWLPTQKASRTHEHAESA